MANFGTMTKPFHAGRAAHAGVVAARLAGLGFTAAADALEHPQGFLSAVSPEGKADREGAVPPLGEEWQIVRQGISIKKYPACYCTHRALDGMLELLGRHPLKPAEIARITVVISKTHSLILRNHAPQTGLEAKFSMEFAMAAAVIARRASLGEYTDAFVRRPDVQELMRKAAIVTNENYDPEVSGASVWDQVTVELANGERIESEKVRRARGHAERPLGEGELFDKFRTCFDALNFILDADIRSFFTEVSQEWVVRFLGHRIGDKRITRLVQKWLRAGILEDGIVTVEETGTGQGSAQ
jgi:2-methylcitrate dehydratase PrpD